MTVALGLPGLGDKQMRALIAAPEVRVEDAAALWREVWGGESTKMPPVLSAEHVRLLLLASIAADEQSSLLLYPSRLFVERLLSAAPVVDVTTESGVSNIYKALIVEGMVVLRPEALSSGLVMARQPSGTLISATNEALEVPPAIDGEDYLPLSLEQIGEPNDAKRDTAVRQLVLNLQDIFEANERAEYEASNESEEARYEYEQSLEAGSGSERRKRMYITTAAKVMEAERDGPDQEGCPKDGYGEKLHENLRHPSNAFPVVVSPENGYGAAYANLSFSNFLRSSLDNVNFEGANLGAAFFNKCNLREANLQEAHFRDAHFEHCNLYGAKILCNHNQKVRVTFEYCDLRRASMTGANMRGVRFTECDLSEADLRNSAWTTSRKHRSINFYGADLGGADLRNVKFTGCNLQAIRGLAEANLEGCDLRDCFLDRETKVLAALKGALVGEDA